MRSPWLQDLVRFAQLDVLLLQPVRRRRRANGESNLNAGVDRSAALPQIVASQGSGRGRQPRDAALIIGGCPGHASASIRIDRSRISGDYFLSIEFRSCLKKRTKVLAGWPRIGLPAE